MNNLRVRKNVIALAMVGLCLVASVPAHAAETGATLKSIANTVGTFLGETTKDIGKLTIEIKNPAGRVVKTVTVATGTSLEQIGKMITSAGDPLEKFTVRVLDSSGHVLIQIGDWGVDMAK